MKVVVNMKIPKVGKRIIKTMIAVFLSISLYIVLLAIDELAGFKKIYSEGLTIFYTPFFAAIAAVYALHRDKKSSYEQAKIRGFGSIIGGYFGMLVMLISEYILINILDLPNTNIYLFYIINYSIVSLSLIPLIVITIMLKQRTSVFITCLTFFSVTISIRNGGLPVAIFATNRVISTIVGIGISLFVNNISTMRKKNSNILFVTSLDNNLLSNDSKEISPYIKYKLNNLYYKNMPLAFATTRTLSSLEYIFDDIDVNFPLVVMNGAAVYHFVDKIYDDIYTIPKEVTSFIDKELIKEKMNAFMYAVDDNMLHCYYHHLRNEEEIKFYQERRKNNFDNFVRATMPKDLEASLYIIIEEETKIAKLIDILNNSVYIDYIDLVIENLKNNYSSLKINSKLARKENSIQMMKDKGEFKKLIVCGSGHTDIELIKKADFSFCLSTAPKYIKEEVDLIIGKDPEDILKIFEKIYYSYKVDNTIQNIKNKWNK